VRLNRTGGPGDFVGRLQRLRTLERECFELLAFEEAVLNYQVERSDRPELRAIVGMATDGSNGRDPLEFESVYAFLAAEVTTAIDHLHSAAPGPLQEAGAVLASDEHSLPTALRAWWSQQSLSSLWARWFQLACAPLLEGLAQKADIPPPELWGQAICPLCGGIPSVAAIAEVSGEFMQGAPRFLICTRCATWWRFARAVCPGCSEHDPKRVRTFRSETWPWARLDCCQACNRYLKTFDLREPGGMAVVPLVDDLATLPLDLWAQSRQLVRMTPSHAGI
jgi:formate dehydrogenase accessory protein FdhE